MNADLDRDPGVWDAEAVLAHVHSSADLAEHLDLDSVEAIDRSTGNLNSVFLLRDAQGRELFLKQAPPHMRINPRRTLSPDRILREADALRSFDRLDPGRPVGVVAVHEDDNVVVMESLSDHTDWRVQMNAGEWAGEVCGQLGEFVGRVSAQTHPLFLGYEEHVDLVSRFANPELCRLTDAVIFAEPYRRDLPHHFRPALTAAVEELWTDAEAMRAVNTARTRFATAREGLLHGDLHSGSVMVDPHGNARVIDPEFVFVGPVGFDLGLILGSLWTQAAREVAVPTRAGLGRYVAACGEVLDGFRSAAEAVWLEHDLPVEVLRAQHDDAIVDAARMGACDALRRLVHVAPAAEIQSLDDPDYLVAGTWLIALGRLLLCQPEVIADPAALATAIGAWSDG